MPTSWPNTITKGSPILASDIAGQSHSLRTVIDSHRQALGLPPYPWAEPVTAGLPIKAAHYLELYAAIRDLWDRKGIDAPMTWSSRVAPAAGGGALASHINDLRNWVNLYERYNRYGSAGQALAQQIDYLQECWTYDWNYGNFGHPDPPPTLRAPARSDVLLSYMIGFREHGDSTSGPWSGRFRDWTDGGAPSKTRYSGMAGMQDIPEGVHILVGNEPDNGGSDGFNDHSPLGDPNYTASTIAFVAATKKITDTAGGLQVFKAGDTIVVKGSAYNDGTYTVAAGNMPGELVVNEALADEAAGALVSIGVRRSPDQYPPYPYDGSVTDGECFAVYPWQYAEWYRKYYYLLKDPATGFNKTARAGMGGLTQAGTWRTGRFAGNDPTRPVLNDVVGNPNWFDTMMDYYEWVVKGSQQRYGAFPCDFWNLHYYTRSRPDPDPGIAAMQQAITQFRQRLVDRDAYNAAHGLASSYGSKPILVTEWAGSNERGNPNGEGVENSTVMRVMCQWFRDNGASLNIRAHMWFLTSPDGGELWHTELFDSAGAPTTLGTQWKNEVAQG